MATRTNNVSPEVVRELLDYDPETGQLTWLHRDIKWFKSPIGFRRWNAIYPGTEAGTVTNQGYRQIAIFQKTYRSARLAWAHYTGEWPRNLIDHINRDRLDDRIKNLREASYAENMHNRSLCGARSGLKGVHWSKKAGKWQVVVRANNKAHYLGLFKDINEADKVARAFREEAHRDFATHK